MKLPRRIVLMALACASIAGAADAVVTLQYQSPSAVFAAGTSRLETATVKAIVEAFPSAKARVVNAFDGQIGKLSTEELAKNYTEACAALQSLNNGALLVLNCHSSIDQVGVPFADGHTDVIPWGQFWKHFGVANPPRLAMVCLNGCVGATTADHQKIQATDVQLEALRGALGTQALVSGKRNIATEEAQADLSNVMTKMKADAGAGWDLDLSQDKGAFKVMKVISLRTGPFFHATTLTFNALKLEALTYGRPGVVKSDGDFDTVQAHEDDVDASHLAAGAAIRKFDPYETASTPATVPFVFQFRPRGEVVKVEFRLEVEFFGDPSKDDAVAFLDGPDSVLLLKEFDAAARKDGVLRASYPAAPGKSLKEAHKALFDRLATGRLRCLASEHFRVNAATMSVTYAPK